MLCSLCCLSGVVPNLLDRIYDLSACSLLRAILRFYRGLFRLFLFILVLIWLFVIFLFLLAVLDFVLFSCLPSFVLVFSGIIGYFCVFPLFLVCFLVVFLCFYYSFVLSL